MRHRAQSLMLATVVGLILPLVTGTTAASKQVEAAKPYEMTVQVRQGRLMAKPRMIGTRVLQVLPEGTVVRLRDENQAAALRKLDHSRSERGRLPLPWLTVQPEGGRNIGYLHRSTLIAGRVQLKSTGGVRTSASSEEMAIAGRGFDELIEQRYRTRRPDLNQGYLLLDEVESDPLFSPGPGEVTHFMNLEEDER